MLQPIQYEDDRNDGAPYAGIVEYSKPDTVVMIFFGEYDIAVRDRLKTDLARLAGVPNVVLDLSEVEYLDAGTIGEIVHLHNVRAGRGFGRETIVIRKPYWLKLFSLLKMTDVFNVVETLDAAIGHPHELIGLDSTYSVALGSIRGRRPVRKKLLF